MQHVVKYKENKTFDKEEETKSRTMPKVATTKLNVFQIHFKVIPKLELCIANIPYDRITIIRRSSSNSLTLILLIFVSFLIKHLRYSMHLQRKHTLKNCHFFIFYSNQGILRQKMFLKCPVWNILIFAQAHIFFFHVLLCRMLQLLCEILISLLFCFTSYLL